MIYSPSRTKTWDFCPIKSKFESADKWMPKFASKNIISQWHGRAFAKATEFVHKLHLTVVDTLGNPSKGLIEEAVHMGQVDFSAEVKHHCDQGLEIPDGTEAIGTTELGRSIPKYIAQYPFGGWNITDVETELPDHGRARIDVGGYDPHGILSVADIKYKRYLKPDYVEKTISGYRYDWQFLHYSWAYGEYKGVPCYRMYLCLVIAQPTFSVRLIPFEIHPETQQAWHESAKVKWRDMAEEAAGRRPLAISTTHEDKFGQCIFQKACFVHHFDPDLMKRDYIQVERRR